jgi:hypothetical protein
VTEDLVSVKLPGFRKTEFCLRYDGGATAAERGIVLCAGVDGGCNGGAEVRRALSGLWKRSYSIQLNRIRIPLLATFRLLFLLVFDRIP